MSLPTQKIIACPICKESILLPMEVRVREDVDFRREIEVRVEIDERPLIEHIESDLREGEMGMISDFVNISMQIDEEGQPFISVDESEGMTLVTALGLVELGKDTIVRNRMEPEEEA